MQIHCPRCAHVVAGADVDLPKGRALCRPCGELFALPSVAAPVAVAAPALDLVPVAAGPLDTDATHRPVDHRYREDEDGDRTTFTVTPPRTGAIPILGFAAFWDGFLLFWYAGALHSKNPPLVMLLFPLLHVAAGVFITMQGLVQLFNATTMTLDRERFALTNGPIPQPGAREPTRNLERFEIFETGGRRGSVTWKVRMLTTDGRSATLPVLATRYEHVAYVAARLNASLARLREPATYRG